MPKIAWLLLVVFLPLIGAVLWFVLGREYGGATLGDQVRGRMPQAQRSPQSHATVARPPHPTVDTRTTEEQLRDVEREIEEYRVLAELQRRRRELEERERQAVDIGELHVVDRDARNGGADGWSTDAGNRPAIERGGRGGGGDRHAGEAGSAGHPAS